jgi:hypothetical protein
MPFQEQYTKNKGIETRDRSPAVLVTVSPETLLILSLFLKNINLLIGYGHRSVHLEPAGNA